MIDQSAFASPVPRAVDQGEGEFSRGWRILLAASLGIGLGMSPLFMFTSGTFAIALEGEFGWSRGEILAAAMFDTLAVLICGPLTGRFIDRIGARRIAIFSMLGIGITTMALCFVTPDIWSYYALYALRSAISVGTLPPTFAKVLNSHFDRKRGMALGIALCTTGISGMFLPSFVQSLIDALGWRMAFIGLGLLPLAIALPTIILFLPADGPRIGRASQTAQPLFGITIGEAMRGYRFWLLAGLTGAAGLVLGGTIANLVPMLVDRGFKPAEAAAQAGIYGLTIVFGRLASGWLLDRFWAPAIGSVFLVAPCLGMLLLASSAEGAALITVGVVLVALASGAEFDLVAFLTSRYFGQRHFSTIYATQHACFGLCAGLGPALFGTIRDQTGSYAPMLYISAVIFAASAAAILALGRYPRWDEESA